MPTSAQFKCQVHANKKPRPAWGDNSGGWVGGAWKTRLASQKPTKGNAGWMMSKDGRAWTPGPGRYSDGNPHGSSVRYDRLKYSFFAGTLDVQKPRWPGDFTPTLGQAGGVVVNPVRGFSMGTGFSPGQTLVHNHEKVGKRTKGFTYQGLAPDLNMGEPSVSTRAPLPGQAARPAGGPRPGIRFVPSEPSHPSCQVFNTTHGTAHMQDPNSHPGPGNYGSDYTFSNIGTLDNPVGRITGHDFPPAFDFGRAQQRPPAEEDSDGPGPNAYNTDPAFPHLTQFVRGKGHYVTSTSIGGKMLGDRRPDPAEAAPGPGPAAYHPEEGYDCLSHLRRSDFCEIKYVDPPAEAKAEEDGPGPQAYELAGSIEGGIALRTGRQLALGGEHALGFGSRWSGFGEDRSDVPGPGNYQIHEPVWTGGMAPLPPSWTIGFGERPPINGVSEGPGPAGYEGMGDIKVTHEGDVYIGDPRASGTTIGFGDRPPLNPSSDGPGPAGYDGMSDIKVTHEGDVYIGDPRASASTIGFADRPPLNPRSEGPGPAGYDGMGDITVTHEGHVYIGDARASGTTIGFGERPPLQHQGDGPGPAGYDGMGDIPVTHEGHVYIGDARARVSTIGFSERPPLSQAGGGPGPAGYEGMGDIKLTREGHVCIGDERAGPTIGFEERPVAQRLPALHDEGAGGAARRRSPQRRQGGRGVTVRNEAAARTNRGEEAPTAGRSHQEALTRSGEDVAARAEESPLPVPFKSAPSTDEPESVSSPPGQPRRRRGAREASTRGREAEGGRGGGQGAEIGESEGSGGAGGGRERGQDPQERRGFGGWGGAEFAGAGLSAAGEGEREGAAQVSGRRESGGERDPGRRESGGSGAGRLRERRERRAGPRQEASGARLEDARPKETTKAASAKASKEEQAAWFPELEFEQIATAERRTVEEEEEEEGKEEGKAAAAAVLQEDFSVERGRRRVEYREAGAEGDRAQGEARAFHVESGRRRVAPSTVPRAPQDDAAGDVGSVAGASTVEFTTASDMGFGGGSGFAWAEGQGRRRRGRAAALASESTGEATDQTQASEEGSPRGTDSPDDESQVASEGAAATQRTATARRRRRAQQE